VPAARKVIWDWILMESKRVLVCVLCVCVCAECVAALCTEGRLKKRTKTDVSTVLSQEKKDQFLFFCEKNNPKSPFFLLHL